MSRSRAFDLERKGETLILNLRKGMQDFDLQDETEILEHLRIACINDVIVDCHDIDFLRSTGLGLFVAIGNRLKSNGGKLVFCNVSTKGMEVLHATRLDRVWKICETREEAMEELVPPQT